MNLALKREAGVSITQIIKPKIPSVGEIDIESSKIED